MIIGFLAGVAIVTAGKESGHLGDDVIMIVVHVEVNLFVFLRAVVGDVIVVLFRDNIDLDLDFIHVHGSDFSVEQSSFYYASMLIDQEKTGAISLLHGLSLSQKGKLIWTSSFEALQSLYQCKSV